MVAPLNQPRQKEDEVQIREISKLGANLFFNLASHDVNFGKGPFEDRLE